MARRLATAIASSPCDSLHHRRYSANPCHGGFLGRLFSRFLFPLYISLAQRSMWCRHANLNPAKRQYFTMGNGSLSCLTLGRTRRLMHSTLFSPALRSSSHEAHLVGLFGALSTHFRLFLDLLLPRHVL